jgi:hypothetical protein
MALRLLSYNFAFRLLKMVDPLYPTTDTKGVRQAYMHRRCGTEARGATAAAHSCMGSLAGLYAPVGASVHASHSDS